MPPTKGKPASSRKRFDIANLTTGQVFEIKPDSPKRREARVASTSESGLAANFNAYLTHTVQNPCRFAPGLRTHQPSCQQV